MSVKERAVSRMYRVAVCEDEKNLREDLCAQCAALLSGLQIEHTVTPYSSAEELEAAFSAGAEFSLLCLDILMDGKTGMKLAQELRERDDRTSILFITGSTEFLKDGPPSSTCSSRFPGKIWSRRSKRICGYIISPAP